MPTITERQRAVRRAASRRRRLLADLTPDAKAKVVRLKRMPTPVAERPEPNPYEKFGGIR